MSEKKAKFIDSKDSLLSCPGRDPGMGGSHILIKPDRTIIAGGGISQTDNSYSVDVSRDTGTVITGPLGIMDKFHNIKIGSSHTLNDLMFSCLPSTAVTPIPVCNFANDIKSTKKVKDAVKSALSSVNNLMKILNDPTSVLSDIGDNMDE